MTGPSGWKSPYKKPDCELWPDIAPGTNYKGKQIGKLTILQPVCKVRTRAGVRKWIWLAECSCGGEILYTNIYSTTSCGCAVKEGRIAYANKVRAAKGKPEFTPKPPPVPRAAKPAKPKRIKKQEWRKHCGHGFAQCVRFCDALGERVFEKVDYPSCYQADGGCYTAGRDELRYMEGIVP